MALLGGFAGIAVVLATVGILGVVWYATMRRTREIGIRVALGATARSIVTLIMGQGMAPVLLGVGLGVGATALLTRGLVSFLYEVAPFDPWTLGGVVGLLIVVALLACALPARWASRIDAATTLRAE